MSTLSAIQAAQLDPQRMPRHVAIIMDGNGRWARSQGWRRVRGHEQGAKWCVRWSPRVSLWVWIT